ncbi:MAG: hypothetical protein OXG88_02545 [Gammaproteobacteria bacterium]|nr:hypothetical protein [Gammaproteobacteria bacterium]
MKRTIAIVFLLSFSIPAIATPYWYGIAEIYFFGDGSPHLNGGYRLGIGRQLNEMFGIEGQLEGLGLNKWDIRRESREQFDLPVDQALGVDVKTNDYLSVLGTVTIPFPFDNTNTVKLIGKAGLSYHWLKYDVYLGTQTMYPGGGYSPPQYDDDPFYELDEKDLTPMVSLGIHVTARSWFQKTNLELGLARRFTEDLNKTRTSTIFTIRHRF